MLGVTISAITGSENAMEKAQEARTKNDEGAMKDAAALKATNLIQEYMDKKYVSSQSLGTGVVTAGDYVANNIAGTEGGYTYTVSNKTLTIADGKGNEVYGAILDNGNIDWNVEIPIENIYARLYTDGTLILSHDNDYSNDSNYVAVGSTIDIDYKDIHTSNSSFIANNNYDDTEKVISVYIKNSIWPINMSGWFYNCTELNNIENIDLIKTDNLVSASYMFYNCQSLTTKLDLSAWTITKDTDIKEMFTNTNSITELNLSGWHINCYEVVYGEGNFFMSNMNSLKKLNLSNCTFYGAVDYLITGDIFPAIEFLNFSNTKGINITSADSMCKRNKIIETLDLSQWDFSNNLTISYMFLDCEELETIYVNSTWNNEAEDYDAEMFSGCISLVGGNNTTYNSNHTGKEYARIDGGTSAPGYFTTK